MDYRVLGWRTGLRLTIIGLGAWGLGSAVNVLPPSGGAPYPANYGDVSDDEAEAALRLAFEAGLNFVDTAPF